LVIVGSVAVSDVMMIVASSVSRSVGWQSTRHEALKRALPFSKMRETEIRGGNEARL